METAEAEVQLPEIERSPSPRVADWFWQPWYAKLYLALMAAYWIGLEIMIAIPYERLNLTLANTMVLLVLVFNPITVATVLGFGLVKAKVACGDWAITSGQSPQRPLLDPYSDPFDCRSGDLHLRHIGAVQD